MRTTTTLRTRRRLALSAAALSAALALTACGGGSTPEDIASSANNPGGSGEFDGTYDGPAVELAYWNGFTGGDGPFMTELVEKFNAEHENITVVPNTIQWADFYQRVPAAVNAGEGPDVGVMHFDQLSTNAARNVIVPLDDVAETLDLSADDFTEEVWNAGIYQDQRYGIPLDVHSLAMYYNVDHFEEAGITEAPTDLESFTAALDALQEAGHETPFWMPTLWPAHLMFLSLTWQNGGEPYAADGASASFGSPEAVEALAWQRSIVEDGYSPANIAIDSQYVAFKNGENSITWDGIWQINDLEATDMNWGMAPIPTIFDEQRVWASSHQFFMTKQATGDPNKFEAAQVFLAWMSEQSGDWAGAGMIPARQSVRDSGAMDGMPQESIAALIEDMRFVPNFPGLGTVTSEAMEPAVSEVILGNAEAEAALGSAQEKATELMKNNLEQFGG
ncbi:ABC transporter substrate-binding protein [Flavimobilis marinus]|uniref:Multiple sugar transport system substrate-binding protein n=1 Tax=Flavimobilis marinus TaxID=285351 RepID=A0A1I2GX99_9MICO|nr:ABC transporter substrate-binding protein [Flavimobilis marinus]GHG55062.1 ABC transporter substrate-binding protein [Flavimobilis marinus]SFF21709.1 multiple sugar transport system substrate-binding protein [Flavimobilis marinus]